MMLDDEVEIHGLTLMIAGKRKSFSLDKKLEQKSFLSCHRLTIWIISDISGLA